MRLAVVVAAALALPAIAHAKTETTRIEIARGRHALVTLTGEESAGQFTIWSGPGTSAGPPGGPMQMTTSPRDFADWLGGAVDPPGKLQVYEVRFYCAARGESPREEVPSNFCYGVRYGIDPQSGQGYIQIPPVDDSKFRFNTQAIARGVEGSWFRSSDRWEELVRPRIDAAVAGRDRGAIPVYQQPYIYRTPSPAPSRTAVGAKPALTPKR